MVHNSDDIHLSWKWSSCISAPATHCAEVLIFHCPSSESASRATGYNSANHLPMEELLFEHPAVLNIIVQLPFFESRQPFDCQVSLREGPC